MKDQYILLIEADPAIAHAIEATLAAPSAGGHQFHLIRTHTLAAALAHLPGRPADNMASAPWQQDIANSPSQTADLILLGLTHDDEHDRQIFNQLTLAARHLPMLLLSDAHSSTLPYQPCDQGIQDILPRSLLRSGTTPWLLRVLDQAMERKQLASSLEDRDAQLFAQHQLLHALTTTMSDAVIILDAEGKVSHLNTLAERTTGWQLHEALEQPIDHVLCLHDCHTQQPTRRSLYAMIFSERTQHATLTYLLRRRDGSELKVETSVTLLRTPQGCSNGSLVILRDVGENHGMALKMAHLAQHDSLTDLPNRALLQDRLVQTIVLAQRHHRKLALLYMDLDRFKHINDTLGHPIGDKLLQVVAERLQACVRYSDTISRLGGDEFVILLSEIEATQDAALCAEKLLDALSHPIAIDDHQLHITLSIGISLYPEDGEDASTLLRNADTAMYHAKSNGRANFQFFRQTMNERLVQRQTLENSLRQALDEGQFVLHYQPRIDMRANRLTAVEALLRWQHPHHGLVAPALFVPVAIECGLMPSIGNWVLQHACQHAALWRNRGLHVPRIAINISSHEFRTRDFLEHVRSALQDSQLPAHALELELTEGALVCDLEFAQQRLHELKQLGIHITLDDFGTGRSNLGTLKRFPIDSLKIDRSFVHSLTTDPADAAIVTAVIGIGRSLNYRVVAEGVETLAQRTFLQQHHCDESQGFHHSHPLSAEGLTNWLQQPLSTAAGLH